MQKMLLNKGFIFIIIILFIGASITPNMLTGDVMASPDTIYVPEECPTIEKAVDNTNAGNTVDVGDIIFSENINVYDGVTIQSEICQNSTIFKAVDSNDNDLKICADSNGYSTKHLFSVDSSDIKGHLIIESHHFIKPSNIGINWWNSNWDYRKLITVNHSLVDCDLSDFPILVDITDSDLASKAQDDGDDICFILWSDNSTKLNHEIELFNGTSGELVSWVNITSLSGSTETKIWMYYGNDICGSQENITGTWDSNFTLVVHFSDPGINVVDSINGYSFLPNGDPVQTEGLVGYEYDLDGINDCFTSSSDMFTFGNSSDCNWSGFMGILDVQCIGTQRGIVGRRYNSANYWIISHLSSGANFYTEETIHGDYIDDWSVYKSISENTTFMLTYHMDRLDPAETETWYYINKDNPVEGTYDAMTWQDIDFNLDVSSSETVYLGSGYNWENQKYWNGTIDEYRFWKGEKSRGYINTTYNTIFSQSDFISIGSEQTEGGGPPVANDDYYTIEEDKILTVPAPGILENDTDPDNDSLIATLVTDVIHGILNLNSDGAFDYTPDEEYFGLDSFTYRAFDGLEYSNEATVYLTVTAVNDPPNTPSNPNPPDGATDVSTHIILSWIGGDPEGDNVTYDVYFGDSSPPSKVAGNQTATTYDPPGELQNDTTFYWQIIAWDEYGASATGPIWSFTTEAQTNQPPYEPSNPVPNNGATDVSIYTDLSWSGGDPDGDNVTYDVYFGTNSPPPKVSDKQSSTSYNPNTLEFNTTYYWQIVAWDEYGLSTIGPVWSFTTGYNNPPNEPSNPIPANGAANVAIDSNLKWTGGDPDGDTVTYDIYFGTATPPPLKQENHTSTIYDPGTMSYSTTYYWQIIAYDEFEVKTEGIIWYFTTEEQTNREPIRPVIDGVHGIHVPEHDYDYDIVTTDPDNDDVFYYIDWGDGTFEDWDGPYLSGVNITKTHSWPKVTKLYEIKAKAKDIYGDESDWGSMYVFVLNSRNAAGSILVRLITRILERFPIFV